MDEESVVVGGHLVSLEAPRTEVGGGFVGVVTLGTPTPRGEVGVTGVGVSITWNNDP